MHTKLKGHIKKTFGESQQWKKTETNKKSLKILDLRSTMVNRVKICCDGFNERLEVREKVAYLNMDYWKSLTWITEMKLWKKTKYTSVTFGTKARKRALPR